MLRSIGFPEAIVIVLVWVIPLIVVYLLVRAAMRISDAALSMSKSMSEIAEAMRAGRVSRAEGTPTTETAQHS